VCGNNARMTDGSIEVDVFMAGLDHPLKETVSNIRAAILGWNDEITEHIKWNAPSFCINGEDRVTMNLRDQDHVKLIFHRGAKVKDASDFEFEDSSGRMVWLGEDRAVIKLTAEDETAERAIPIAEVVSQWMAATS
jgi:hypothetical protein